MLRLLANSDVPLGVHDLARALQLVPSTCLHLLRALAGEGLIAMDPVTKKYSAAAGLVALARTALRHNPFPKLVQADLVEISNLYGATAIAVEASGLDHMVVVALARGPSPLQLHVEVGSRFPALISATGRCIAAFGNYSQKDVEARFNDLHWDVQPSFSEWQAEVELTRKVGFAVDDSQYIRGVSIVAAPVPLTNRSIHAIVIVGFTEQIRRLGLTKLGQDLRERADRISKMLRGTE